MPEITRVDDSYKPQFIVTEDDFEEIELGIDGQKVNGRDVYGFFVTEEEFKKISPEVCFDGWYPSFTATYKKGEPIDYRIESIETSPAEGNAT